MSKAGVSGDMVQSPAAKLKLPGKNNNITDKNKYNLCFLKIVFLHRFEIIIHYRKQQ
jgi:hypothetical protein